MGILQNLQFWCSWGQSELIKCRGEKVRGQGHSEATNDQMSVTF